MNYIARTQTGTIAEQLAGGVRYFDIRPCMYNTTEYWTYHGPYYGDRLDGPDGILHQVNDFMNCLSMTDRELVILNISHFYNFAAHDHANLVDTITNILAPHLVPHQQVATNLFNAAYNALLTDAAPQTRSRVAILYDCALDTPQEAWITAHTVPLNGTNGIFLPANKYPATANGIRIFDQYSNKRWVTDGRFTTGMRPDQIDKLTNRGNYADPYAGANWPANAVGGVAGIMHLFSWTLTPQPMASPLNVAQTESNPALGSLFTSGWPGRPTQPYRPTQDPKINILYVDDYASNTHHVPGSGKDGWALPVYLSWYLNNY